MTRNSCRHCLAGLLLTGVLNSPAVPPDAHMGLAGRVGHENNVNSPAVPPDAHRGLAGSVELFQGQTQPAHLLATPRADAARAPASNTKGRRNSRTWSRGQVVRWSFGGVSGLTKGQGQAFLRFYPDWLVTWSAGQMVIRGCSGPDHPPGAPGQLVSWSAGHPREFWA